MLGLVFAVLGAAVGLGLSFGASLLMLFSVGPQPGASGAIGLIWGTVLAPLGTVVGGIAGLVRGLTVKSKAPQRIERRPVKR